VFPGSGAGPRSALTLFTRNVLGWPDREFVGEVLLSLGKIELIDQVIFAALALLELTD